jgi:hypothetical protein
MNFTDSRFHKADVNTQDKFLRTPSCAAAQGRYGTLGGNPPDADCAPTVELLIKNGAALNRTASHQTALHLVCMSGQIGVAKSPAKRVGDCRADGRS